MKTKTAQQIFKLTKSLPKFDYGRVDFTNTLIAPVLNMIIYCNRKILILKRSKNVNAHHGLWGGVTGFIDESKSLESVYINP